MFGNDQAAWQQVRTEAMAQFPQYVTEHSEIRHAYRSIALYGAHMHPPVGHIFIHVFHVPTLHNYLLTLKFTVVEKV